jgi:protocatechuate 3,4-dioxygenase beta subunit
MSLSSFSLSRRAVIRSAALSAVGLAHAGFWLPGALADELTKTPAQTEGPFYPDKLPLDTDNDLIVINDALTSAVGTIAHFGGKILDAKGNPIKNAVVEIWQCDNSGAYLHSRDTNKAKQDSNFQGFGRFVTGSTGEYYFRTIKPVPYPGRTPHIHVKIKKGGKDLLTSQCYIEGHPDNGRDGVFKNLGSEKLQKACSADFALIKDSKIGAVAASWNIVLGVTPEIPD